ncbi:ATP-dependent DNA helicase PcrA [Mesoplasma lactucae ATCC 49193]|uniref:DNA 3'-5' helicase n=2 Tax=Mesoplasma lactucae TaxID=138853 RepID=A0A291ISF0_9MOLU|nr:UvrD-helicase domain-containing protein [Mesoplasma lactucae]ATG97617.1 AAA family ATPase [Mesoplasma lactucae ATCC 49193]ATZ19922.1 ATP-dependent DNA helicase [Mesoplasma lactucae ATCC 49193]MCL8216786.1 ATP-dependent DNA helicase PcrA [Mesoplasma lactucae ATCC 49193]
MNELQKQLDSLNAKQLSAVVYNDGPLRIIAGAGSGKTKVITTKIAYLVEELKVPSYKIIALTFTNKAAAEMRNRVEGMLGNDRRINPFISTFHSFCYRVLREDGTAIGLQKNFSIIDTADQKTIVRKIMKDNGIDKKGYSKAEKKALTSIENWKNNFLTPDKAIEYSVRPEEKDYALVYREYQKYLDENNYVDFNDLQLKTYDLFESNQQIRDKWASKFEYVMVDEFQDTNQLQFELIQMLTSKTKNLTVVGDPDQTIYTWRGAKVDIILNFERTYKEAKTIVLDRNYRSTKQILDISNDFISHNTNRQKKELETDVNGEKVIVHESITQQGEAEYVAKEIQKLVKTGKYDYSDFFILYRMNAWSREFEHALESRHIPYQLIGGIRFRDRKVIKDATAFLRAIALEDNISVERILKNTPKVGDVTIEKTLNYANANGMSMFTLLTDHMDDAEKISKYLRPLGEILQKGKQKFNNNDAPVNILKYLLKESGFEERIKLLSKNEEDQEYIEAFYDQLKRFDDNFDPEFYDEENKLMAFLQEESLGGDVDEEVVNKVTLLTVHASKGLENKVVFVSGLSTGIFPSKRSALDENQLEEERRALYVGMTRAEELLYLTYVQGEFSFIANQNLGASKFLKELDPKFYNLEKSIGTSLNSEFVKPRKSEEPNRATTSSEGYQKGDIVEHIMFGSGVVVKLVEGDQIQIAFNNPSYGVRVIPSSSSAIKKSQ